MAGPPRLLPAVPVLVRVTIVACKFIPGQYDAAMTLIKILEAIWTLSAIGLSVLVLLHSPKGDGLGALGGQAQLFTSTKSAETTLNRLTWTLTVLFMGLTAVLSAGWLEIPAV